MLRPIACMSAFFLLHCAQKPDPTWELRTFDVPSDVAPELVSALRNLFYMGKDAQSVGQATLAPSGQVLVAAPHAYFSGIESLMAASAGKRVPQPASIELTYWVVLATRSAKAQIPAELLPLSGTLDALTKSQGGLAFTALETVSLRSMSGSRAFAEGTQLHISQTATVRDGTVVADIDIVRQQPQAGPRGRIETRVKIVTGQTVVLGQSGYADDAKEPTTVFYVVRADVETR